MRHIVVPTDFSETARAALEFAVTLCRDLRGRLTVLHVIYTDKYRQEFAGLEALDYLSATAETVVAEPDRDEQVEKWKTKALEKLNAAIDPAWRKELTIEAVVAEGRPSDKIVEYARGNQGNMIVMGTHGRRPVAQFFLGSVTENVLRSADCPVVVVRHP